MNDFSFRAQWPLLLKVSVIVMVIAAVAICVCDNQIQQQVTMTLQLEAFVTIYCDSLTWATQSRGVRKNEHWLGEYTIVDGLSL